MIQHFWHWAAHPAAAMAAVGATLLVQSTLLIAAGLFAAALARGRSAAVRSAILRATLVAVIACPLVGWILARAGANQFRIVLPAISGYALLTALAVAIAGLLLIRLALAISMVRGVRLSARSASVHWIDDAGRCARIFGMTTPPILQSDRFTTPCLVGFQRPVILLPTTAKTVRHDVLIHELAHLRRRDCLWHLFCHIARALLWFQPLMWLLTRRIEQAADEVCDDFVVAYGGDRAEYARALVDIAERHQMPWVGSACAVGMAGFKSTVSRRVVRIMDNTRTVSIDSRRTTLLMVLALSIGATLLTALLGTSISPALAQNAPAAGPRLAIPDAAAQAKKEKLIRDVFGNFAAAPLAERPALAAKLIEQGMATADDPAARYVMLRDGGDLAASAGDATTAMRAAALLASVYAVDLGELKLSLLRRASNAAATPAVAAAVAGEGLNCANEAAAAGNYDLASRFMFSTEQAAHTAKDITLILSVQSRAADIKWLQQESVHARTAEEKLNKSPTDPDANHTLGRFFCLVRGDWAHGLIGLSKGSNLAYHAAATADLTNPTTSDKQVATGDLWWDLAEKETAGAAQRALRRRAGYWYSQAAANPQLAGLSRALVEKKLSQIPPPGPGEAVAEVPPAGQPTAVPPAIQPPAPAPVVSNQPPPQAPVPSAEMIAFARQRSAMPPEQQMPATLARLKQLNGGVDIKADLSVKDGEVSLDMSNQNALVNIEPLYGMRVTNLDLGECRNLTSLNGLQGMPLTGLLNLHNCWALEDISALKGMKLSHIAPSECRKLKNLDALQGMPLTGKFELNLTKDVALEDISGLKGMPLTSLILTDCKNLKSLNGTQGMPLTILMLPKHLAPGNIAAIVQAFPALRILRAGRAEDAKMNEEAAAAIKSRKGLPPVAYTPPPGGSIFTETPAAPPSQAPPTGEANIGLTNTLGMKLVRIEPGEFMMGSPETEAHRFNGEILHHVKITRPFLMATTTVTQAQWKALIGSNPSFYRAAPEGSTTPRSPTFAGMEDNLPVEQTSWNDAVMFCEKLSAKEGRHYRLPTEAEWEYACRAGTQTAFGEGSLDDVAWYAANSGKETHEVATKKPNRWGLYDMIGNVWQWCSDGHGPYTGDAIDPQGSNDTSFRITRGGSCVFDPSNCRAAMRRKFAPVNRNADVAFRVCLDTAELPAVASSLDLTTVQPTAVQVGFATLGVNQAPAFVDHLPKLNGEPAARYFFAHAPSKITFAAGSFAGKTFVAKGIVTHPGTHGVIFIVQADGKEIFRSKLAKQNEVIDIEARLPADARVLELIADPDGVSTSAWAFWTYPAIKEGASAQASVPAPADAGNILSTMALRGNGRRLPDGSVEMPDGQLDSAGKYAVPFRADFVAKTNSTNLRISFGRGQLIFNWAGHPETKPLRFTDPAKGPDRVLEFNDKGSIPPNEFVRITWIIDEHSTSVFVNGEQRAVVAGEYVALSDRLSIYPKEGSVVTVKSVSVSEGTASPAPAPAYTPPAGGNIFADGPAPAAAGATELLSQLNLQTDVVAGTWTRGADGITSAGGNNANRIRLPFNPPPEYDLRVIFTLHAEKGAIGVLLAHNDASGMWFINYPNDCRFRGAGDPAHMMPEKIVFLEPRLTIGAKHEAIIKVRNNSIATFIDGKAMSQITEDYSQCRLEKFWSIGDHAIGLTGGGPGVTYHSVEVHEVSGSGALSQAGTADTALTAQLNDPAHWAVQKGTWHNSASKLRGEGESEIWSDVRLPRNVALSFRMNVIEGSDPRMDFYPADMRLNNIGPGQNLFPVLGPTAKLTTPPDGYIGTTRVGIPYANNQPRLMTFKFGPDHFAVEVDGKPTYAGTYAPGADIRLQFHGGGKTGGITEFSNFRVEPMDSSASAQVNPAPAPAVAANEIPARTVNLLPLIDVKRDTMAGAWQVDAQGLSCEKVQASRLGIPYDPPAEYNLHVAFTRHEGGETQIMFGKPDRRVALIFYGENPLALAIGGMDGKPWWNNPSSSKVVGRLSGLRHDCTLKVRNDSLTCILDGKQVFSFKTDYSNLDEVGWWSVKPHLFGVGSNKAETLFHVIEVEELTPSAAQANSAPPSPAPAYTPPAGGNIFTDGPAPAASNNAQAFARERSTLPLQNQIAATVAKLKEVNGGSDIQAKLNAQTDGTLHVDITNQDGLVSIEPLYGLRISKLNLDTCKNLKSLNGVQGMPLTELNLTNCFALEGDLSMLKGMRLTKLGLRDCHNLKSLSGISGMPLTELNLYNCFELEGDLSALKGMQLAKIYLTNCKKLEGLNGLQGMPLTELELYNCFALEGDLSALKGMQLKKLSLFGCQRLESLNGIQGMPLTGELNIAHGHVLEGDLTALTGIQLTRLDLYECFKLKSLNGIQGMPLTELNLTDCHALEGDLSALKGMPLTKLSLYECQNIKSLDGLEGAPLKELTLTRRLGQAYVKTLLQTFPTLKFIQMGDQKLDEEISAELKARKGVPSAPPLPGPGASAPPDAARKNIILFVGERREEAIFRAVPGANLRVVEARDTTNVLANPEAIGGASIIVWGRNELIGVHEDVLTNAVWESMRRFMEAGGDLVIFEQGPGGPDAARQLKANWAFIEKNFAVTYQGGPMNHALIVDPALAAKCASAGLGADFMDKVSFCDGYHLPPGSSVLVRAGGKHEWPVMAGVPVGKGRLILVGTNLNPTDEPLSKILFEYIYSGSGARSAAPAPGAQPDAPGLGGSIFGNTEIKK